MGLLDDTITLSLAPKRKRAGASEYQEVLDGIFMHSLRPVSLGVALLFALFIFWDYRALPENIFLPLLAASCANIAILLALRLGLHRGIIPARWAHPVATVVLAAILANNFLRIYLQQSPLDSMNTVLSIMGIGCLFLSWKWLCIFLIMAAGGWSATALVSAPSPLWPHFGLAIVVSSSLAAVIHFARMRTYISLEQVRRDDLRRKDELQAKTESLATINRIADSLYHSLDFKTVVERAVDCIVDYMEVPAAAIFSVNENAGIFEYLSSRGLPEGMYPIPPSLPLEGSLTGEAVVRREIVICNLEPEGRGNPSARAALLNVGLKNIACVPLLYREKVLGIVNLFFNERPDFSPQIMETLLSAGKTIALAIANARHVETIEAEAAERKRANEALGLTQFAIDHAGNPIYWIDARGAFAYVNEEACATLGYTREEFRSLSVYELDPDLSEGEWTKHFERLRGQRAFTRERVHRKKDGTRIPVEVALNHFAIGEKSYVMVNARDITERRKSEEDLRASEERYRQLVDMSPIGIAIHRDGKLLFANRTTAVLLGAKNAGDLIGANILDFVHPDDRDRSRERIRQMAGGQQEAPLTELRLIALDGRAIDIESTAVTFAYQGQPAIQSIYRDISDRKQAEKDKASLQAQLIQAQKMEAIGNLAGGVAHDFNNLLSGILGYANMLKLDSQIESKNWKAADVIEKAAERASDLTKQLLGFARKGKFLNTTVDMHATIREVVALLERTLDRKIVIKENFKANPALVLGDPSQLQQVILNLAVNARDAMPEGGYLVFATDIANLGESDRRRYPGMIPGRYLTVSISDTGRGIPKDVQSRVFEPFFTTKEQGKGTGMGLAMVYGIVKNHGGSIHVYSEEGRGARFTFYLPLASNETKAATPPPADAPVRGKGRILVVDDEQFIRLMVTDMLESLGYEVVTASDGREAVEYYAKRGKEIDLAVIDMIMPIMGGRDCFRALKQMNPDVRAVLSSGYGPDGDVQDTLNEGMLGFAQKPYRMSDLSEIILKALS